jgi:hypothetical protein
MGRQFNVTATVITQLAGTISNAQQLGLAEDSRRTIGQLEIHLATKLGVKCCTAASARPDLWS